MNYFYQHFAPATSSSVPDSRDELVPPEPFSPLPFQVSLPVSSEDNVAPTLATKSFPISALPYSPQTTITTIHLLCILVGVSLEIP